MPVLKYRDPVSGNWVTLPATAWPPNEVVVSLIPSISGSTTSASYVNWPNAGGGPLIATLVKRAASTRVVVHMIGSAYLAGTVGFDWGVSIDGGAGQLMIHSFYNIINTHMSWSGLNIFSGLTVGSHTFTMQVKLPSGSTANFDSGDHFFMSVREVA